MTQAWLGSMKSGNLYENEGAVFCCVYCQYGKRLLRSDWGDVTDGVHGSWRNVTHLFENFHVGRSLLYIRMDGWTDAAVVVARAVDRGQPTVLAESHVGEQVWLSCQRAPGKHGDCKQRDEGEDDVNRRVHDIPVRKYGL